MFHSLILTDFTHFINTLLAACNTPTPNPNPNPNPEPIPTSCVISTPPTALGLSGFYSKYCSIKGIPIVSSSVVPDAALARAWFIMDNMLKGVSDSIVQKIVSNKTRMGILGVNQVITNMPEYANLDTQFPLPNGESWNTRARGLGATPFIPLSSGAEENILCYPSDVYKGEDILLHEFAHTILIMGVEFTDTGFRNRLNSKYISAKQKGLWANTYADDTLDEYWAEGVQNFFDSNIEAIPSNGIHNEINTRAELKTYDPDLYAMIAEIFTERPWSSVCP